MKSNLWRFVLVAAVVFVTTGCGPGEGGDGAPDGAAAGQAPAQPQAGHASGRVTMEDASAPRGDVRDIAIPIHGVSDAAEKVSYAPAVNPDGTYRQKLAPGQYRFDPATITVAFNNHVFRLPLEPTGRMWNKDRDAAEGIAQDFVWKVTGPTPYGQSSGLDTNNATHWYGMSIGMAADGYREDIKAVPAAITDGTVFTFTLRPLSRSIDDRELAPISVERTFTNNSLRNLDINDIPPADYELSATAVQPDGTTRTVLLQGPGDYPNYKPSVRINLAKDNIIGTMNKPLLSFVIE